ncbi:hypothetical protein L7F22_033214 [Adiantum nelumboides]|nr:hypothetical protein [Adiantum nelumboides]
MIQGKLMHGILIELDINLWQLWRRGRSGGTIGLGDVNVELASLGEVEIFLEESNSASIGGADALERGGSVKHRLERLATTLLVGHRGGVEEARDFYHTKTRKSWSIRDRAYPSRFGVGGQQSLAVHLLDITGRNYRCSLQMVDSSACRIPSSATQSIRANSATQLVKCLQTTAAAGGLPPP